LVTYTCLFEGGHQSKPVLGTTLGLLGALTTAAVLLVLAVLALRQWRKRRQMKRLQLDIIAM